MDFLGLLSRIASADGAFGALFGRAAGSDGLYRLMELCDRIAVLCGGRITGIVDGRTAKKEELGVLMTQHEAGGADGE